MLRSFIPRIPLQRKYRSFTIRLRTSTVCSLFSEALVSISSSVERGVSDIARFAGGRLRQFIVGKVNETVLGKILVSIPISSLAKWNSHHMSNACNYTDEDVCARSFHIRINALHCCQSFLNSCPRERVGHPVASV